MAGQQKVWFITGVSRGLGKALAEAVLSRNDIVIGTSRSGESDIAVPISSSGQLHMFALDVSMRDEVRDILPKAHALHGRIDYVVNNAGYGLLGPVEATSTAEAYDQLDTNFFGTMYVIQSALPFLREQKSGHIINLSSIAGLAPMGGYGLYAASKYAVEGLSVSLSHELKDFGIKVTVVEPGAFRTDFLADSSIRHTEKVMASYASTSGAVINNLRQYDGKQLGDPVAAARVILEAAESPEPPLHLILGSDALTRARKMLAEFNAEIDKWEKQTVSTDYQMAASK
jgi:NAD(P)-dependent dehydrogenase (short-subunit alcohol dehydrogenase family)